MSASKNPRRDLQRLTATLPGHESEVGLLPESLAYAGQPARNWTPIGAVTLNPARESVVTMASHAALNNLWLHD
jgi:hypothetical protein